MPVLFVCPLQVQLVPQAHLVLQAHPVSLLLRLHAPVMYTY